MPITAVIADDEDAPLAQLRAALQQAWPSLTIVAACNNGVDAWDAYLQHEPSVCFLDIRMPGLSGMEVAQRINGQTPVVFVTAYGDHALRAFDAGAVDYVLKPIEADRMVQAVQRVQQRLVEPAAAPSAAFQTLLAQWVQQAPKQPVLEYLQASRGKEVRLIRTQDVVYFESDAGYTRVVYRRDGVDADALIRTPLKDLLAQIDAQRFMQVHRAIVVNRDHVVHALRVDESVMQLVLRDRPERLPVSRHFQALFKGQ